MVWKKILLVWIYVFWGTGLTVFSQTLPQGEHFFRFLPEKTVAVGVLPDLGHIIQHLEHTVFTKHLFPTISGMPTSPATPKLNPLSVPIESEVFQGLWEQWRTVLVHQTGFPLAELQEIFHHSFAIAVLAKERHDNRDVASLFPFDIAILAKVNEDDEFLMLLEEMFSSLQARDPTAELGIFQFQGETLYQIVWQDGQLYYAMIDQTMLATVDRDSLQCLVQEYKARKSPLLSRSFTELFDDALHSDAYILARLPLLWQSIRPWFADICSAFAFPPREKLLSFMDDYQWPVLAWDLTVQQDEIRERLRFKYLSIVTKPENAPAHENFYEHFSQYQNLPFVSDRLVSEHALYYGARHLNVSAWWQNSWPAMQVFFESDRVGLWLKNIETALQKPLADALSEIGDVEAGLAWYPAEFVPRRSRQPVSLAHIPLIFIVQAAAHHELEHMLQEMITALDIPSSRTSFQNIEILTYQLPFYKGAELVFHHAVVDDVLLFSGSEALIRESIRVARYGGSLFENEEYRRRAAVFPSESATLAYLNLSQCARLLQASGSRQEVSTRHELEDEFFETLSPISPMLWTTTLEKDGFLTESRSPIGGTLAGMVLLWLIFSWMT